MDKKIFEEQLQKIGLSDKEAKFYLAALQLGKSPVQIIAKEAGVNRGTAYNIIETLMEKGLMSSYTEGKKQYFFAESAEKLSLLLEQQIEAIKRNHEEFKKYLPELKKIDNKEKDKPVVRYFEGKQGIQAMVEDMFDVKKGTEIIMVYPADLIRKNFSEKDIIDWRNKRIARNISIKAVYTKKEMSELVKLTNVQSIAVSSDEFDFKSDIAVYEDRVRIASLKNNLVGIIIQNKDIADTLRTVFELAWKKIKEKAPQDK